MHLEPFRLQDWELRGDRGGHNQETALCKSVLTIAAVRNDATKFGAISTPTSHLFATLHYMCGRGADQSEFREKGCSASGVGLADRAVSVLQEMAEIFT